MSCRVLPGDAMNSPAPLPWTPARAGPGGRSEPNGAPVSAPASAPDGPSAQLLEQARKEGFRQGEAAGRNRATAELQPVLEKLARSIEELAALRPQLRRDA